MNWLINLNTSNTISTFSGWNPWIINVQESVKAFTAMSQEVFFFHSCVWVFVISTFLENKHDTIHWLFLLQPISPRQASWGDCVRVIGGSRISRRLEGHDREGANTIHCVKLNRNWFRSGRECCCVSALNPPMISQCPVMFVFLEAVRAGIIAYTFDICPKQRHFEYYIFPGNEVTNIPLICRLLSLLFLSSRFYRTCRPR